MTEKRKTKRNTIHVSTKTFQRLKRLKGIKTWDELFSQWLNVFEGMSGAEDEIRYITNGDWDGLMKTIEELREKVQQLHAQINPKSK